MKKGEIILNRSIWPDVDGPEEVNRFLGSLGIKVSFLLDSGLRFEYDPEKLEPYKIGNGTLYFKDPVTKSNLFHYYEDLADLVFENLVTKQNYRIPIYEEFEMAGD